MNKPRMTEGLRDAVRAAMGPGIRLGDDLYQKAETVTSGAVKGDVVLVPTKNGEVAHEFAVYDVSGDLVRMQRTGGYMGINMFTYTQCIERGVRFSKRAKKS